MWSGHANPAGASQAGQPCTLTGSAHSPKDEWAGCLQVKAEMAKAPEVGGTAAITFTIFAQRALDDVQIEADLPGNLKWAAVPAGLTAQSLRTANKFERGTINRAGATMSLQTGSTTAFKGSVTATGEGTAQIRVRAKYAVPGGVEAAEDSVFLTIGQQSSSLTIASSGVQATAKTTDTPARSQVPAAQQRAVDAPPSPAAKGLVSRPLPA